MPRRNPQRFLPLSPATFHLLLSLAEGEKHGYALKREIAQRTDGTLVLGANLLYGSINRMLEQRLIEESDKRPDPHLDDKRRRYYRITPFGRLVAQAETARMRNLVQIADKKFGLAQSFWNRHNPTPMGARTEKIW